MKNIAVLNPLLFHKKIVCQGFKGRGQFIGKFRDWGVETIPLWGRVTMIERGTQNISFLQDATVAQKFRYCAAILWLLPLIHNYPHLSTPPTPTHPPPQKQRFPILSPLFRSSSSIGWTMLSSNKKTQNNSIPIISKSSTTLPLPQNQRFPLLSLPLPLAALVGRGGVVLICIRTASPGQWADSLPALVEHPLLQRSNLFSKSVSFFVVNKSVWAWLRSRVAQTEVEKEENDLGLRHLRSQWGSCYIRFRFDSIRLFMAGCQIATRMLVNGGVNLTNVFGFSRKS